MTDPRRMEPFDPKRFLEFARRVGHSGSLGVQYRDHGKDWVELCLPYDERLVGMPETGILASGPIVSLMDMCCGVSIWCRTGRFHPQATLDLRVDYLRPATPGNAIVGRGECYRIARSVAFVRGTAHDGDPADLVAHVSGTFMFTD